MRCWDAPVLPRAGQPMAAAAERSGWEAAAASPHIRPTWVLSGSKAPAHPWVS